MIVLSLSYESLLEKASDAIEVSFIFIGENINESFKVVSTAGSMEQLGMKSIILCLGSLEVLSNLSHIRCIFNAIIFVDCLL
jgi:hypothetical protein